MTRKRTNKESVREQMENASMGSALRGTTKGTTRSHRGKSIRTAGMSSLKELRARVVKIGLDRAPSAQKGVHRENMKNQLRTMEQTAVLDVLFIRALIELALMHYKGDEDVCLALFGPSK